MVQDSPESLLAQQIKIDPDKGFTEKANVKDVGIYADADQNPEGFWAGIAEELHWFSKWDQVLEWDAPDAKWFVGGTTNISYNCIDRHINNGIGDKVALYWEGEPGDERVLTYNQLHLEVCKFANALKSLGVVTGDRVAMYMPMIPELAIAMLACARIGAVHNVVFGGFSASALEERINDSEAKIVITADGGYRRGSPAALKPAVDEALQKTPSVEKVVVVKRVGDVLPTSMLSGRDVWWHDLVDGMDITCEAEQLDAEQMLFILYTSGTTGKPKGIVHTTGGYMVGTYATTKYVFDMQPDDVYWCTADIGWVTGHSYIVYGPMANGATSVMYEGTPDFPDKDRFWSIIEKYKVSIFYTAPTAIRACMRWGDQYPEAHDLSSLRIIGSVGEPINPQAWLWYREKIGGNSIPVVDTYWQTETGSIIIAPIPGLTSLKPGSATLPFPTISPQVVDEQGNQVPDGEKGFLLVTRPWPSMLRTLYKDRQRFIDTYWAKFPGRYLTGDHAVKDKDGYFWLLGRADDVINVAGHRLSTMEIESALVDHSSVAEAAAIGRADELKGQAIATFVLLKDGIDGTDDLQKVLKQHVSTKISPIARPADIFFVAELPKTRSGKIMRRLLKDVAEGRALGDTTTLADPNVMSKLKGQYEEKEG